VLFDGVDIREATLDSLRGQMGIVFQENFLFNTTVRENIRLGNLAATDAEVEAAAKAAEIHDMILSMPQGYDTVVGERGGRLSGGQRQRIAIARAILRNPAVLLLDEATSALDPRTEAAITETLDRLSRGRTTIAVTHRLSSVVNADQIYVFDRGMLVEQGNHDELLRRNGLYARLWQEQGGYVIGAGVQYVGVEAARLQAVPLFAQLDGDLLAALAQRLAVERYPAGDVIVNEGEPGDKLYVIHKGQAEVLAYDPAGNQRHLAVLREGDYFGEVALLYDVPRTATIRALTPVQLYSLSKEDFNILLGAVPGLREQLERTISQREQLGSGD
jgi:ATP-binding cassette subfamily B protein